MPIPDIKNSSGSQKDKVRNYPVASLMQTCFKKSLYVSEEDKMTIQASLANSAIPGSDFLVLALLSGAITTFGLLSDSLSVVIGGMLIGPLMMPILNAAMAVCKSYFDNLLRNLITLCVGIGVVLGISIILSLLLFRLTNFGEIRASSQFIAMTSPSLMTLLIALVAGSAAAFALAHPRFSTVLPGAAIALTLEPAISAAGISIHSCNATAFLGASVLFLINLAGLFMAGVVTFFLMGFKPDKTSA